jgi:hypothetical protein
MVRWAQAEDNLLRQLIRSGTVNPANLEPDYLFQVTQDHFPAFVGEGATGRSTAIQRLRRKFRRILEERRLRGARRREQARNQQEGMCVVI